MKKTILFLVLILLMPIAFAHSGRTDSKGGHYNRSTGEYHYHHGYPAHDICGINCPYKKSTVISTNTSSKSSKSEVADEYYNVIILSLFLGYFFRFIILLPLLLIDKKFNKNFFEKLTFDHPFISTIISAIVCFIILGFMEVW